MFCNPPLLIAILAASALVAPKQIVTKHQWGSAAGWSAWSAWESSVTTVNGVPIVNSMPPRARQNKRKQS